MRTDEQQEIDCQRIQELHRAIFGSVSPGPAPAGVSVEEWNGALGAEASDDALVPMPTMEEVDEFLADSASCNLHQDDCDTSRCAPSLGCDGGTAVRMVLALKKLMMERARR